MEKVRIDDNGFVCKSDNCKQKEGSHKRHSHDKHENFESHSHRIADVATMTGIKPVMSNSQTDNQSRMGIYATDIAGSKVQLPIDHRCHPFWLKK